MAVFEEHKSNIHFILSFGSHLISVDEASTVRVWIVETTGTKYMLQLIFGLRQLVIVIGPSGVLPIQGVIERVISKSDEREAQGRFEIMSTITP